MLTHRVPVTILTSEVLDATYRVSSHSGYRWRLDFPGSATPATESRADLANDYMGFLAFVSAAARAQPVLPRQLQLPSLVRCGGDAYTVNPDCSGEEVVEFDRLIPSEPDQIGTTFARNCEGYVHCRPRICSRPFSAFPTA